ncbi:transcriptional elongation factor [Sheeppox virus]|uniref:Late transcription elongation factor OPG087 n=2 Tax=Sheeppox virus TaxID=10266 RepID=A0A3F2YKK7_SHEVT|nr:transcriptional elongation factor [Sheeppox virus]AOE46413.1 transcriptional elongation factor [Sheeppox virus]AOE46562.1 transcriptional elongation factor [Sheeppox virus]AVI09548.1 transcriptional elongation factor [Sheeppox virus]AVI09682.1 transcriptional elongation factor [Sheeppox virus]QEJ79651.1 late transcription elongation factor [Sheeppox virus]
MPFRDLILFHLSKFILTKNEDSIKTTLSLCRGFDVDLEELMISFLSKKYLKKLTNIEYNNLLPELTISFPNDIVNELIKLRLYKFYKIIKPSLKLKNTMKGIVFIKNRNVYILHTNDELIDFLFKEYDPYIYTYEINKPDNLSGSKIILCGYDKVTFYTYLITKIVTNQTIDIVVTDKCIELLLQPQNKQLLKDLFNNSNDMINKILKKIFYSVIDGGGQTP